MKRLTISVLAAAGLAGCVAVPAPYPGEAYYYPAPAVGVGVYAAPVYRPFHHHHYYRHWR